MLTPEQKKILMKNPKMKELKKKFDAIKLRGGSRMKGGRKPSWWDYVYRGLGANLKVAKKNLGKTVKKAQEVDKYLRDTKIISNLSEGIETGALGLTAFQPELAEFTLPVAGVAEVVKDVAKKIGYGRRMHGGSASYTLSTPSKLGTKMKGNGSSAFGSVFEARRSKVKF